MRWMFNSNDRNLRSTEYKSTQCNHQCTPLNTTHADHNIYRDPVSDVDCINYSSDDDDDDDIQLSLSSSSEASVTNTSSLSQVEEIHSYSEADFFGELGGSTFTNNKDIPAAADASYAEISDFEQDPLTDSGIYLADNFAQILTKFDDILRDVDFVEGAINVNKACDVSKPCGKVYPFVQEVDISNVIDDIVIDKEKIEECDGVSSDDVILVELLRRAWFVLMLYILIKVYFITI